MPRLRQVATGEIGQTTYSKNNRVLIIEDERNIAESLKRGLEGNDFEVELAFDGNEGFAAALAAPYDAMIIDLMLPGRDGFDVLRELREKKISTPIMIVTARGEVVDRVQGLNLGADDYLTKPYDLSEVVARLRALIRRASGEGLAFYRVGDLTLNLLSRVVTRGAREINLTQREFALLEYMARTPGLPVTRSQIHEQVWGYHFDPGTNLVDVYIQRLRRKIDDNEPEPLIHTVRGTGYCVGTVGEKPALAA